MRTVAVAELRHNLSRYLLAVQAGEELLIADGGQPVARIVPVADAHAKNTHLQKLIRTGAPEHQDPFRGLLDAAQACRSRGSSPPSSPAGACGGAVKFWDASALIPLCVTEVHSETVGTLLEEDPDLVVWWGSAMECRSAFARSLREGKIDARAELQARTGLEALREAWDEI